MVLPSTEWQIWTRNMANHQNPQRGTFQVSIKIKRRRGTWHFPSQFVLCIVLLYFYSLAKQVILKRGPFVLSLPRQWVVHGTGLSLWPSVKNNFHWKSITNRPRNCMWQRKRLHLPWLPCTIWQSRRTICVASHKVAKASTAKCNRLPCRILFYSTLCRCQCLSKLFSFENIYQ
jgi:hypothetical protein